MLVAGAALTKRATVTLPARVQYAWPHVSRRYLYVATSSSASGYGPAGTEHHVTAVRIDPATGALTTHGEAIRLPTRPIHMTTDIPSENILVAFNNPSALRVYRINPDFSPGEEVKQPGPIDAGVFAHQVRVTPDNRLAILVTRGNEGTPTRAEDPGALKVFDYTNGVLSNAVSVAPDGGSDFGPRHLDFRPRSPGASTTSTGRVVEEGCHGGQSDGRPGTLARVAARLARARVNIKSVYATTAGRGGASVVITVGNAAKARPILGR